MDIVTEDEIRDALSRGQVTPVEQGQMVYSVYAWVPEHEEWYRTTVDLSDRRAREIEVYRPEPADDPRDLEIQNGWTGNPDRWVICASERQ